MRFIHISIAQALVFSALAMHMYVWNLGSQKKSWFQIVSVSDGFGMFWVFVIVGPVTPHARIWYCRIWGSL